MHHSYVVVEKTPGLQEISENCAFRSEIECMRCLSVC